MVESRLTTEDNPFDPFDEWDEWVAFDDRKGYHTLGFLARLVHTSEELSEVEQDRILESAMDEIVAENVLGLYKKVSRESGT